jgi:hypothetical protein
MTPRPEEAQSYTLQQNAYVNKAYITNEKAAHLAKSEQSMEMKLPTQSSQLQQQQQQTRPIIDFDDLLPHIGDFGKYQKILFLLMIPFAFFVAFVYFSQIFITLVPEQHWCYVPELQNLTLEQRLVFTIFRTPNSYLSVQLFRSKNIKTIKKYEFISFSQFANR